MGDANPIRTIGDYSKPSHEGYMNTIELPVGNNVVPLRSDTIRERTRMRLFHFSLRDQASNWLERLPAGSITTWEDLTTRFLAQFFLPGRTTKLRNDIQIFQQHHGESLSEAWTCNLFAPKCPEYIRPPPHRAREVQRLMESHLAPTQPTQVNKITTSYEIYSGPYNTQYCVEDPEQAFVEYTSSRTDKAGEGLVSNFMASQDARLSKFKADFKQQQSEMTNKIDTVLKAITDRIAGTLPSDTVKNPKLEVPYDNRITSTFEVGQSSRSVPEPQGAERVSMSKQPTLTTWVDPINGRVYTDIAAYVPPVAPVQAPSSPKWSSSSLSVSPSSSIVP
ncbi:MAK10-like protein [Tanacetum coccineum]